jgi:hypothetical protein
VAKQVAPGGNSVAYSFEYCKEEITYSPVGSSTVYQSDTIAISYPYGSTLADQTVNWLPEKFSHTNYRYYSTLQHLVPGRPAYGKRDNRYICCWGNYPYYQLYIKNEFEYAKGLGQVHYKNCWTYFDVINYDNEDLVYYKKGNEHWGSPVAASCQVMVPVFSVTPDPVVLGYTAGSSAILTINTNQAWTVTSTSDFFDYEPATGYMNGTVTITAKNENTGSSVLVGALNVNFPTESKSIKVHQLINPVPTTIYHPDTIVLGWKRLSLDTLYVTSNTTFELICTPCPSWFLPSTYIGTGTEIVRFASFEDNLDSAVRMAVVTFTGPAGSKDIVVTQKGKTAGFGTRNTFGVKLSPNPVRESAVLSFSGMPGIREKHLTLFDYTGRVVYQSRFTSLEYQFQRGSLPPGIYLLKVSYRHDLPDALINVMLE